MNYTYLLRCADGSLYCGWTNHLKERIEAHNTGKGAKYTKGRGPVMLVWSECFATKEEAMKREAAVKKMTKAEKEAMALGYEAEGEGEPLQAGPFRIITCVFGTETGEKIKVKATEAKMARGEMVRFLAETDAESFSQVKRFDRLGFSFCPEKSTENEFVFIKGKEHDRSVE